MKQPSVKQMQSLVAKLQREVVTLRSARIHARGKNKGDGDRGAWCTELRIARAIGPWDLDAFSNPRSHIESRWRCMLEDGGDGFGDGTPGSYRCGAHGPIQYATEDTRFFGQPPYDIVARAIAHFARTRFCFLLRFDPRTRWFRQLYARSELVVVPYKCNFEPPPGVKASSSTNAHALYYRRAEDATPEILRLGVAWRKTVHV